MNILVYLILLFSLISVEGKAFEPYSGISCHNSIKNGNIEFFSNMMKTLHMPKLIKE